MKTITPPHPIQVALQPDDTAQIIATFVAAFRSDPAVRWLFPDEDTYADSFTKFAQAFAGPSFDQGTVHFISAYSGAAAWFAPGVHGDDEAVIEVLEKTVHPALLPDAFALFEQMDNNHPTEDHWYLPLLGVQPASQGQELGSHLLRHVLQECDRNGKLVYLEASSARSLPFYQRHGFRVLGEIQAGSSPTLYPMTREPKN